MFNNGGASRREFVLSAFRCILFLITLHLTAFLLECQAEPTGNCSELPAHRFTLRALAAKFLEKGNAANVAEVSF